jgi:predicted transcriptional regulator
MPQSVLEMAKDLVMAQIQAGALSVEDMQHELQKTYVSLMELKEMEDTGSISAVPSIVSPSERTDWRKSITKHAITCMECGSSYKQLSVRHLREHDLDARSYRTKYGIPRNQPLSAKETTAMRKKIVQKSRPWEKAPTYIKAHAAKQDADTNKRKNTRRRRTATATA